MSVPNSRRSVLAAVTLGILGTGCDASEHHEEYATKTSQLSQTPNWEVKGVMQGTVNSDELLDVIVRPSQTQGTTEVFVAGYENGQLGLTSVDPAGSQTRGTITNYSSTTSGL